MSNPCHCSFSLLPTWGRSQCLLETATFADTNIYDLKHSQKESLFQRYQINSISLHYFLSKCIISKSTLNSTFDRRPRPTNQIPCLHQSLGINAIIGKKSPFLLPSRLVRLPSFPLFPLPFPTYTIASSNTARDAATTITMSSNQPINPLPSTQHQTHPAFRYPPPPGSCTNGGIVFSLGRCQGRRNVLWDIPSIRSRRGCRRIRRFPDRGNV